MTIEPGAVYQLSVTLPSGVVGRQFLIELQPAGSATWRPVVPGVVTNVGVAKGCLRVRVSDGAPFDVPSEHVTAPVLDCSLAIKPGVVSVIKIAKIDRILADSFLGDPSVTFRLHGQDAPVLRTRMSLSRSGYDPTLPELYLPLNGYWVSFAREPGESYVAGVHESAPALRLRLETPWTIDVRFEGEATLPDAPIDPPCEFVASHSRIHDVDEHTFISRPGPWRTFQKDEGGAALRYVTVSCGPDRVDDDSLAPVDPTGFLSMPNGTIARRHQSELGPSWRLTLHRVDIAHPVRAGLPQPAEFVLYRKSESNRWRAQMKRPIATGVGMYVAAGDYQLVTRHVDGSVTTDSFTIAD